MQLEVLQFVWGGTDISVNLNTPTVTEIPAYLNTPRVTGISVYLNTPRVTGISVYLNTPRVTRISKYYNSTCMSYWDLCIFEYSESYWDLDIANKITTVVVTLIVHVIVVVWIVSCLIFIANGLYLDWYSSGQSSKSTAFTTKIDSNINLKTYKHLFFTNQKNYFCNFIIN